MNSDASSPSVSGPSLDPDTFRLVTEASPTPTFVVAEDGKVVMASRSAESLFGYDALELVGQSIELLLPEGLRHPHREHMAQFLRDPKPRPMGHTRDLLGVTRDGSAIPLEIGLSPVQTSSGLLIICTVVDLSARKETEEDLHEAAARLGRRNEELSMMVATDSLTSLKSRQAFMDHLSAQLEVSVRHLRPLSVLILDIDHFKPYNDTYGHLAGDEVLRQVGRSLSTTSRRSDIVARLGGEEFGILLPETDREGATILADRFRQAVEATDWSLRPITVSVGATTIRFADSEPRPEVPGLSEVLTAADQALYRSKDGGRNRVTHSMDL